MSTPHTPNSVPPLTVTYGEARWLRRHTGRNPDAEQPDRLAATSAINWAG